MSYRKDWIFAEDVKSYARKLTDLKLFPETLNTDIDKHYLTPMYTPNLFVRIGLFLFTLLLIFAGAGIFSLTFLEMISNETAIGFLCLLLSGGLTFMLEMFIKSRNHYKSGIDDCLLYVAVLFAVTGCCMLTGMDDFKIILLISTIIIGIASWRYADRLLTILALAAGLTLVFQYAILIPLGKLLLPFIFLLMAIAITFFAQRRLNATAAGYHGPQLKVLKFSGLMVMYLSVNYFVVREGNVMLNSGQVDYVATEQASIYQDEIYKNQEKIDATYADTTGASDALRDELLARNEVLANEMYKERDAVIREIEARSVPMALFFILATALFPVLFIILGLMQRDRLLLYAGLLILAFSVFTYKNYVHLMSIELTLTLSGALLLAGSWLAIRYLKRNSSKFTFEPDKSKDHSGLLNLEGVVIGKTMGPVITGSPTNESGFGGGKFGGGGAGG